MIPRSCWLQHRSSNKSWHKTSNTIMVVGLSYLIYVELSQHESARLHSAYTMTNQQAVLTAVSVVFPWSTWPMVPMLTCGLLRVKVDSSEACPPLPLLGHRGPPAVTADAARRALLSLSDSRHFDRALAGERLATRRSAMFDREGQLLQLLSEAVVEQTTT